jgi:hypothetical protein
MHGSSSRALWLSDGDELSAVLLAHDLLAFALQ